jgi:hypothetical protein
MINKSRAAKERSLLGAIQRGLPQLLALLDEASGHWQYEDGLYRLYHQSFKVYGLQDSTLRVVEALTALSPDGTLDKWFSQIIAEGTGKTFSYEHNQRWLAEKRPIVEAFLHAKYMLEMVGKYGQELEQPPEVLPSGWAAVLSLYGLR